MTQDTGQGGTPAPAVNTDANADMRAALEEARAAGEPDIDAVAASLGVDLTPKAAAPGAETVPAADTMPGADSIGAGAVAPGADTVRGGVVEQARQPEMVPVGALIGLRQELKQAKEAASQGPQMAQRIAYLEGQIQALTAGRQQQDGQGQQSRQPHPLQVVDASLAAIDARYEKGDLDMAGWMRQRQALVDRRTDIVADMRAQAYAAPLHQKVQQLEGQLRAAPMNDLALERETEQIIAAAPWIEKVPDQFLRALHPDIVERARQARVPIDSSPAGTRNYRLLTVVMAEEKGLRRMVDGGPAAAATAPAGTVSPGSPNPPANPAALPTRANQPPAPPAGAATLAAGATALPGGLTEEAISRMKPWEIARLPDSVLEAIAPTR